MRGPEVRRQLPFSLLATVGVVVAPALIVAFLPGSPGPLVGIPVCIALSLTLARMAAVLWRRSPRSREVLFADLMLWGWVRRVATERRLAQAQSLVEDREGDADNRVRALERVSAMLESRDAYTRHHSVRVTRYSEAIAQELGLPEDEVARVRKAAALHDVGKFFTPREVLNKPGRLTEEEFAVIKKHPGQGADLLRGVVEPEVEAMIRYHHERLGGGGYPDGLVGDAIPLGARIIAVADTFDAMTSTRAYRSARAHAKALTVLREEAGVALDAGAVAAFETVYSGRRGTAWSSVASGMTQTLAPLREALLPAARALPAIGASAAITAPVVVAGGPAVAPDVRDATPRTIARAASARPTPQTAAALRLAEQFRTAAARRERTAARTGGRREPGGTGTSPDRLRLSTPSLGGPQSGRRPRPGQTTDPSGAATPDAGTGTGAGAGTGTGTGTGTEASEPGGSTPGGGTPEQHESPTTSSPQAPSPAATSAPTTAPSPSTPAPAGTPEVGVGGVEAGPITVPPVEIDVPGLPVELPEIKLPPIKLPPIKLPPIKLP